MKNKSFYVLTAALLCCSGIYAQTAASRFDMSLTDDGCITESATQNRYRVESELPACQVASPDGMALRFDGYSNYVKAAIPAASLSTEKVTFRVVLAAETYPMMNTAEAENTPSFATVCGNLDENAKKGFALFLSSQGDLRFTFASAYANGYLFTINGTEKLKCGQWNVVSAVLDKAANVATLYLNGASIGTCRMSRAEVVHATGDFLIGKGPEDLKAGPFLINTFCGLVDDIAVYNEALSSEQLAAMNIPASEVPDFRYPEARYAGSIWRPAFHGMPSGGWTNESHGMTYADGRFHVFFQKNANGPYMARLHWGHISSDNLFKWREEPIAVAPSESYDIKGCWSGCVFTDDQLTAGKPGILYTAVDNARAVIAQASPVDEALIQWQKNSANPIINGRPSGLSDDFRDPYFFTAGGAKYIIVGTSKGGVGACTLHKYENGAWTNDGSIFFQGSNVNQHGFFWEMPTITEMPGGKWLFTCTPLGTGVGVRTLYWVGSISAEGKFVPDDTTPRYLEMNGISRDGFGLLSPTIYQHEGKTLLLGIVPDKLPGEVNYRMGWAHNYSLPREVSLGSNGQLIQKPYSALTAMRSEQKVERSLQLLGAESLAPVTGRQLELLGEFTVGTGEMGFRFCKSGDRYASLSYDVAAGTITLDLSKLDRTVNDAGVYNGVYRVSLPERPAAGEKLKMQLFLDGSIADVFIADKWAFSVRLFPNDAAQQETEVFATSATEVHVQGWLLDASADGIEQVFSTPQEGSDRIYDLQGRMRSSVPQQGFYIMNGKKYYVR